jgi:thiamine biosynthesis lipoprotein
MLAIKTLIPKPIIFRRSVRLIGSQFEISVVGNNPHWADERIDEAVAEIIRVEKLLSAFSDESAINEINRGAGERPVKTNAEIFRLIDRLLQISELTHGAFDFTYNTTEKRSMHNDLNTAGGISYQNVILDAKAQTVFLKEKGMRIGFGAIINGYAADKAKYLLQMQGVQSGVINAGGDLIAWGTQPDNQPWTVAAADPGQKNQSFASVDISNMAIATSANNGKHTAAINKTYLSAIDPKKGFPVSEIKSVSIISPTAELADAMATPLTSIGINAGLYMINQLNQMACVIIDDHDRIYTSKDVSIAN